VSLRRGGNAKAGKLDGREKFLWSMFAVCAVFLVSGYILLHKNWHSWHCIQLLETWLQPLTAAKLLDKGVGIAVSASVFFAVLGGYRDLPGRFKKPKIRKEVYCILLGVLWALVAIGGVLRIQWGNGSATQLLCLAAAALALVAVGLREHLIKE